MRFPIVSTIWNGEADFFRDSDLRLIWYLVDCRNGGRCRNMGGVFRQEQKPLELGIDKTRLIFTGPSNSVAIKVHFIAA